MKAMIAVRSQPRELSIPAREGSTEVLVSVRDRTVDSQAAGHLFERFFTTKPQGIGLSNSRRSVEAHRGRHWPGSNPDH
jgi:signal transduction histidine kinase